MSFEPKRSFLPRPPDANKYTVGTVGVVGGSRRFPHAPVFAALGARAAGAGLIALDVPDASRFAAAFHVPEATFSAEGELPKGDVIVVGPGLGLDEAAEARFDAVCASEARRIVVDADAITFLSRRGKGVPGDREVVLTPHEGEAARLLGSSSAEIRADRSSAARAIAAKYGATVVLKGPDTLVVSADGSRLYENATGNPQMALGGMGDLLAGVIAARWARLRLDAFEAAASGVYLHGLASDELVADRGDPSIVNTAESVARLRLGLEMSENSRMS